MVIDVVRCEFAYCIVNNFKFSKRFPFDTKNPIGYLIATILQLVAMSHQACYIACFLALALGAFLFSSTLMEDVTGEINAINDDLRTKKSECHILQKFSALIQLHSDAKQLSVTAKISIKFVLCICTTYELFFLD